MARKTPPTTPWIVGLVVFLALDSFAHGAWGEGLLLLAAAFAVVVGWCVFRTRTRCGVVTQRMGTCRLSSYGVLFGCKQYHYWEKFALRLGRRPRVGQAPSSAGSTAHASAGLGATAPSGTTAVSLASSRRETVTYYCTIISTLAGLVSAIAAVMVL